VGLAASLPWPTSILTQPSRLGIFNLQNPNASHRELNENVTHDKKSNILLMHLGGHVGRKRGRLRPEAGPGPVAFLFLNECCWRPACTDNKWKCCHVSLYEHILVCRNCCPKAKLHCETPTISHVAGMTKRVGMLSLAKLVWQASRHI
jgi:hypothetical protein